MLLINLFLLGKSYNNKKYNGWSMSYKVYVVYVHTTIYQTNNKKMEKLRNKFLIEIIRNFNGSHYYQYCIIIFNKLWKLYIKIKRIIKIINLLKKLVPLIDNLLIEYYKNNNLWKDCILLK